MRVLAEREPAPAHGPAQARDLERSRDAGPEPQVNRGAEEAPEGLRSGEQRRELCGEAACAWPAGAVELSLGVWSRARP